MAAVGALLTALIEGWRVASRAGIARQALRAQADQFFALIGKDQMNTMKVSA